MDDYDIDNDNGIAAADLEFINYGESFTYECLPGFAKYPYNASLTVTCELSGNLTATNFANCQDESDLITITSQAINTVQADLEKL